MNFHFISKESLFPKSFEICRRHQIVSALVENKCIVQSLFTGKVNYPFCNTMCFELFFLEHDEIYIKIYITGLNLHWFVEVIGVFVKLFVKLSGNRLRRCA